MTETHLDKYVRMSGYSAETLHKLACEVGWLRENVVREMDNADKFSRTETDKAARFYYATVAATLMARDSMGVEKQKLSDFI